MAANRRTVTPATGSEGWTVDGQGNYRTHEEATSVARAQLLASGGGELLIKGEDGRVRQQDTIGQPDPRDSKG